MIPSWDASMETGHPEIDRQHRELIDLLDELAATEIELHGSREFISSVLTRIMDFAGAHFAMEEELMRRANYDPEPTERMLGEHRAFTREARQRVLDFRKSEVVSVLPLQSFLKAWLIDHEFGLDRELVRWIQASSGGSAGSLR